MPVNARLSELQALNVILSQAGESPVSSTTDIPPNASRALEVLREMTLMLQEDSSFWHFNTRKDVTLIPDAITKKIQLSTNVVAVSKPDLYQWGDQELTIRGDFLFDITNDSYTFTDSVKVDMRISLEWDELPVQFRRYVMLAASRQYQIRYISDPQKHSFDVEAEQSARALAIGSETREQNLSMLNNVQLEYNNRRYF